LVKYGLEEPSQAIPVDEGVEPLPLRFDDVDDAADEARSRPPTSARGRRKPA
jgi:hypothetical protein